MAGRLRSLLVCSSFSPGELGSAVDGRFSGSCLLATEERLGSAEAAPTAFGDQLEKIMQTRRRMP